MTLQEFEDNMRDTARIATRTYEAVADEEGEVVIDSELVRLLAAGFLTLYAGLDVFLADEEDSEDDSPAQHPTPEGLQ